MSLHGKSSRGKNTNVHKHFDIPKDAPEGFYDFFIRITDENGSVKEDKHEIELIGADKLPVMPELYSLLIKKSAGHLPETVKDIDFSKVIVADVRQHTALKETGIFTNYVGMPNYSPRALVVGSATDNNMPTASAIDRGKAWESGDYYFGVVYTNITHNLSAHYYIDLKFSGF